MSHKSRGCLPPTWVPPLKGYLHLCHVADPQRWCSRVEELHSAQLLSDFPASQGPQNALQRLSQHQTVMRSPAVLVCSANAGSSLRYMCPIPEQCSSIYIRYAQCSKIYTRALSFMAHASTLHIEATAGCATLLHTWHMRCSHPTLHEKQWQWPRCPL
jgi:hypothetical protein